jgi:hypothetical protein
MRKLILRCGFALGDVVMLTAAVRDLHHWYPGQFLTDVRTFHPDLWEHNPHITPLSDEDPEAVQIDCAYPLIDVCNKLPYHCLQGFIEFLNQRLRLAIKLTAVKGEVLLSDQEKAWYSQVHELTEADTPFWIVAAGGKYDVTVKWWETSRYQQVVEHLRGKVLFVQIGSAGHHHPKLDGVIDLRGKTSLRELIRLVYHAQGVLCPVTALMHLAAAVESKPGQPGRRPAVVIAGGREPVHWESYPGHQFIHVSGALPCCLEGGCWKDRTLPLRDGDKRDRPGNLCVDVVGQLPRCMHMIPANEVVRRIEWYHEGGVLRPLSIAERQQAARGLACSGRNDYDNQPLTLQNAGLACEQFISTLGDYPGTFAGRGIVICGGGVRYFTNAWVCIQMLRRLGCELPIELWHLGQKELSIRMSELVRPLGVMCRDARSLRRKFPVRLLHGWSLKPYAIIHSAFREVLFLDADNVPVQNPEFLFSTPRFRDTGALFWPDYEPCTNKKAAPIWRSCGLRAPREQEFESGQIVVDKARCWQALRLALWFNEQSDLYYRYIHGDKETFHLAFRKLRQPYALVPTPIHTLERTMCQHDFHGRRLFQHRNRDKWDLLLCNRKIKGFQFQRACRDYVLQLRSLWDGNIGPANNRVSRSRSAQRQPRLGAVMISCVEREELRKRTLRSMGATDWGELPLQVQMDDGRGENHAQRQTRCAFEALRASLQAPSDYTLFIEDDLDFNLHLRHNLLSWRPVRARTLTLGGLYNPGLRELACDVRANSRLMSPRSIFGSQAFLISRRAVKHIVANWNRVQGLQDIRISRLVGRLAEPVLYHAPSLVQHVGRTSIWGGPFHQAVDFDRLWKAMD